MTDANILQELVQASMNRGRMALASEVMDIVRLYSDAPIALRTALVRHIEAECNLLEGAP